MSIIYSYPEQSVLNADDLLIGTSAEKINGKQTNVTRNFSVQQIADFINKGSGLIDPVATDFQIAVFNQGGTKLTGSIMSQNSSPSNGVAGTKITISGALDVNNNLIVLGGATIGDGTSGITLTGPTNITGAVALNGVIFLNGAIRDGNDNLSAGSQILLSNNLGKVQWTDFSVVNGSGTTSVITKWVGGGTPSLVVGNSIMTETDASGSDLARITVAGDIFSVNSTVTGLSIANTFIGELSGTIEKDTTGNTKPTSTDDNTVATTAFVQNVVSNLPAGLVFKGTWDADTNNPTLASGGGEITEGNTTSGSGATLVDTTATFIADGVSTTNRVRVENDNGVSFANVTAIVSETELTLSENIFTGSGQFYIIEATPFLVEGNYYIVSVAGNTQLNGQPAAAESPAYWQPGDWVVASSTNVWQKIDNSSILNGQGTGGYIPLWAGNGDSFTLTNSETIFNNVANDRIGIGTILPDSKLDVKETTSDAAGEIIVGGLLASDNLPFGKLSFANTDAANIQSNDVLAFVAGEKVTSSNQGELTFATSSNAAPVERMRINSLGGIKLNAYSGADNVATPTYILGTNVSGEVVKVDGANIPGSISGSGTVGKLPKFATSTSLDDSIVTQGGGTTTITPLNEGGQIPASINFNMQTSSFTMVSYATRNTVTGPAPQVGDVFNFVLTSDLTWAVGGGVIPAGTYPFTITFVGSGSLSCNFNSYSTTGGATGTGYNNLVGNGSSTSVSSLSTLSIAGELDMTTNDITNVGELTATGTISFGSLKDTAEDITITKFVDEADGLANNDNDTTIPTSAAVIDYVTATPGVMSYKAIGLAIDYSSRVSDNGGVVEGTEQVMINTEKLILS